MPTDNNNNQTETETQEQPSQEDLINSKINAAVNAAITSHLKRQKSPSMDDFKALIADQLKSFKPQPSVEDPKEEKKVDPALTAMRAQVEELQKSYAAERTAREKAESKQREDRAFGDLKDSLKSKVRPEMLDFVAKNLFYADKRVEFDTDGNPLFKVRKAPSAGLPEEDMLMPLSDGISNWAQSKEAAIFIPAPTTQQPQQQQRGRMPTTTPQQMTNGLPKYDKPANSDEEKVRRAMEREQILLHQMKK